MKSAIVLCSGGLDSTVAANYIKNRYKRLIILFFDYGQRGLEPERRAAKKCARDVGAKFKEIKIKLRGISSLLDKRTKARKVSRAALRNTKKESAKWYVPFRNGIFLSYASALADSLYKSGVKSDIIVGFKNEGADAYPDSTKEFVDSMNHVLQTSTESKAKIIAPLIKKDKEDIILLGKKLGVDLRGTYSCYIGSSKHCGYCLACRLRQEGFYWANVDDPTSYKKKMKDFRLAKGLSK